MKKICIILIAVILLVTTFPLAALAEEATVPTEGTTTPAVLPSSAEPTSQSADSSPSSSESTSQPAQEPTQPSTAKPVSPSPLIQPTEAQPEPPVILSIDNLNRYEGMDKAYQEGYTPIVKDGNAIIVLPLFASGALRGNALTATPQLGDPGSSPFVIKNYQTTVWQRMNPVAGAYPVPSYLVTFQLPLKPDRVNGVYPVIIEVKGYSAIEGNEVTQSYTTYVTITDGKKPDSGIETPEKPTSQPKVIVADYTVNPSEVFAGQEFAAKITLKNTNEKKAVQNMTVTVSCDSPHFTLMNESSTLFIGKMAKGDETEIELNYKTNLETPAQKYNIALTISYDDAEATQIVSSGVVEVAVQQPLKVMMETPQIPKEVNAGDTMPLTIQVMNLSRSKVFNARVELTAYGLLPTGTAFIGNLEPGTAMDGKMDVFVGSKDMSEGYEGSDKYGFTNGTFTLIYEDANGLEFTDVLDVSTTINAPVINTVSAQPEEKPETASQWWISILIGSVVLGALAVVLVIRRKKLVK